METIYDHNLTDFELSTLDPEKDREKYELLTSQDYAYIHLAKLYSYRNDLAKMEYYLSKVKDREMVKSFRMVRDHLNCFY